MKRISLWLLVVLIAVLWLRNLDQFPGLHADEAWAGLKAHGFLATGHLDPFGMNQYTGAMQGLCTALFFKILGIDVFSLRITGILFNVLGLCLLVKILEKAKTQVAYIFLLFLLQSPIWLLYPRIAWEVSSFTLFFVAAFLLTHQKIITEKNPKTIWAFLFFLTGLLSSYNHIIFSCISLALLLACALSGIIRGELSIRWLYLTAVNMVNISILFLSMNAFQGIVFQKYALIIFMTLIILSVIETGFWPKIQHLSFQLSRFTGKQKSAILWIVCGLSFAPFIYFHEGAVLSSLMASKVFQHVLGLPSYAVFTGFSLIVALSLKTTFLFFLFRDIRTSKNLFFSLFILSYIGLFSFYTQGNSPRYYLALQLFIFLYLAFKIIRLKRVTIYLTTIITIAACINIYFLIGAYGPKEHAFVTQEVHFGNQTETSNHFKSIAPLIDSLQMHRIRHIQYPEERYFLEQPILLMELIRPWDKEEGTSVTIDYGDTPKNGGFIWINRTEK